MVLDFKCGKWLLFFVLITKHPWLSSSPDTRSRASVASSALGPQASQVTPHWQHKPSTSSYWKTGNQRVSPACIYRKGPPHASLLGGTPAHGFNRWSQHSRGKWGGQSSHSADAVRPWSFHMQTHLKGQYKVHLIKQLQSVFNTQAADSERNGSVLPEQFGHV